jgi:hypothetical protein
MIIGAVKVFVICCCLLLTKKIKLYCNVEKLPIAAEGNNNLTERNCLRREEDNWTTNIEEIEETQNLSIYLVNKMYRVEMKSYKLSTELTLVSEAFLYFH